MNKNYEELLYFSRLRLGHIGSMVDLRLVKSGHNLVLLGIVHTGARFDYCGAVYW